jgi:hypothetical protein
MPVAEIQSLAVTQTRQDEAAARADIRRQIGRLEMQLAKIHSEAFPLVDLPMSDRLMPGVGHPRLLDLCALEQTRDALAVRLSEATSHLRQQRKDQATKRAVLEEMLAVPANFKWCKISQAEVGEPGCGVWHSRPVMGVVGMFMGWWRVKVSSGCP